MLFFVSCYVVYLVDFWEPCVYNENDVDFDDCVLLCILFYGFCGNSFVVILFVFVNCQYFNQLVRQRKSDITCEMEHQMVIVICNSGNNNLLCSRN